RREIGVVRYRSPVLFNRRTGRELARVGRLRRASFRHRVAADQSRILQVIHGEFRAFGAGALWVILRAVDGSWWEVVSEDPAVFTAIEAQFTVVDDPPTAV